MSTQRNATGRQLEVSLDPADWDEVRQLGHRMVDDLLAHVREVPERSAWQAMPASVRDRFGRAAPTAPTPPAEVYQEFLDSVLPYSLGNLHPRFWGWVIGSGTITGALAEFLAAAMNANVAGFGSSSVVVEEEVLRWFTQLMGMPAEASGLLTTGASEANLIGMAVGLRASLGAEYRRAGVVGQQERPMIYGSEESHFSVWRAARVLGLGSDSCRSIPSNAAHQIDLDALDVAIARDRRDGLHPCILVGTAGTVGVGAFDDLEGLANRARDQGMWLHVDGAFGAMIALAPVDQSPLRGLGRADSLAFDLHKWLHIPIEAACVLVRDPAMHRATFAVDSSYTADFDDGPAVDCNRFTSLGLQQSRSARAIKVWFSMHEHGTQRLGECIAMNLDQATYLASRIAGDPELELLAPVACQIVCFRARPAALPADSDLDRFNQRLLQLIQVRGIAIPTGHVVRGQYAIRCSITNHRTTYDDLDLFLNAVRETAAELLLDASRWAA